MTFNRSEFMRSRHALAREQRDFYFDKFGESREYSDFLGRETPLTNKIVTYEVSYQLTYRGEFDDLILTPQTFKVIALEGSDADIYNKSMNMFLDSKGETSKNHFASGTLNMIKKNIDIQTKILPRGVEESQRRPDSNELRQFINKGFVVSGIDKIKYTNSKGSKGVNKLDVRHFEF